MTGGLSDMKKKINKSLINFFCFDITMKGNFQLLVQHKYLQSLTSRIHIIWDILVMDKEKN